MNTAIFGGSFNPVHNGHIDIARMALSSAPIDRVIVMPAFIAPFKKADTMVDGERRLDMCRLAFEDIPNISVSDYEINAGGVSYTVNTLRHFKRLYPESRLFLIVGEDIPPTIDRWHKSDEIRNLCEMIVFPRKLKISSTMIRKKIINHEDISALLPPNVAEYIIKNKIYF
ncbi:MAG: nicotinate (nicotinamide) nucleotide adenylyltransferase [Oscillospiraceae bacterium]|nr:nicotinate (nicotinamide) nucleotide adenylyltransferase [Oscillospiraceae bacterium]